jgi:hypothetical protein
MNMQELITLLSNNIATLNNARSTAVVNGDVEAVLRLDDEIAETQATLDQLRNLG